LNAIGERFTAAVEIVKLGFGDGVIDIDGGHEELASFLHLVETMKRRWWFLR